LLPNTQVFDFVMPPPLGVGGVLSFYPCLHLSIRMSHIWHTCDLFKIDDHDINIDR